MTVSSDEFRSELGFKPEFLQDISMDFSNFGMDTVTLGGTLEEKIRAISKIMLWAKDLMGDPEGIEAAVRKVHESGLRANGFQLLKDFEGLSGICSNISSISPNR
jgi:hypothetical protein